MDRALAWLKLKFSTHSLNKAHQRKPLSSEFNSVSPRLFSCFQTILAPLNTKVQVFPRLQSCDIFSTPTKLYSPFRLWMTGTSCIHRGYISGFVIGSGLVRCKVAISGPVNHFNSHQVKDHKLHFLIHHGFRLYHGVLAFRNENIHLNLLVPNEEDLSCENRNNCAGTRLVAPEYIRCYKSPREDPVTAARKPQVINHRNNPK